MTISSIQNAFSQVSLRARQIVENNPYYACALSVISGIGIGMAVGRAIYRSHEPVDVPALRNHAEGEIPDSLPLVRPPFETPRDVERSVSSSLRDGPELPLSEFENLFSQEESEEDFQPAFPIFSQPRDLHELPPLERIPFEEEEEEIPRPFLRVVNLPYVVEGQPGSQVFLNVALTGSNVHLLDHNHTFSNRPMRRDANAIQGRCQHGRSSSRGT